MRYIQAKKPIVKCTCGVCMQPDCEDIKAETFFNAMSLDTKTIAVVKCPLCDEHVRVQGCGMGWFTNFGEIKDISE